jgi:hypothetical protein
VRALRAFGQVDVRADPLSSLPLEMALAECVLARQAAEAKAQAPSPVVERREAAPVRAPVPPAPVSDERVAPRGPSRRRAVPVEPAETVADSVAEPSAPEGSAAADVMVPADVAALRSRWNDVYQVARKINHKTGALLNSGCVITGVEDGTLILGFRHEWMVEKMTSDENGAHLQALREAVQKVMGASYEVRCVYDPQASSVRALGSGGGHLVQAARELGARVVRGGDQGEMP